MIAPGRQTASETGLKIDNRYEVLAELGRGGMGVVYKAKDLKMDRIVAIKLMALPPTEREAYLQRFLLEARSVAKMQHENIVVVHDYGYHGADPYIAMEYVEGTALDKLIASRAHLSMLVKVNYVIQVCYALHYAHQFGIVHRDVKPANIMVLGSGRKVKLLDFGIARAGGPSELSRTGLAMGTTCYMSPEQTRGQKDLDYRSDIFSAGVVLYQLVAGRAPWQGNSDYEIMDKIVREPYLPLSTAVRSYPEGLDLVLERALAKEREQRYETAAKMALELSGIEAPLKEQALEDAQFQFEHGNLLRANELVDQILDIDTRHREALGLRQKLQQMAELQQKSERVRQLRDSAEQAVGQKRYQDALQAIDQAVSLDSANAELLHYRDLVKHELKRREEVRKKLELARRAQEINDLSSAQELVDKALEVDPTDTQARSMKSLLQQEEKRQQLQELRAEAQQALDLRAFTRAREQIQQIESLDPDFQPLVSLRQTLLQGEAEEERRNQIEELVRQIRQALKDSEVKQSMLLTAKALTAFPDESRFIQLRKQAEALRDAAKREQDVQEQMSNIRQLAASGQYNDALSIAEGALKQLGEDHRLHTAIIELRQNAEHERLVQAEHELLARARDAMRAGECELAVKLLSNGRIDFPTSDEIATELQVAEEARARKAAALNAEAARKLKLAEALEQRLAAELDPDRQVALAENAVSRNPENERMQRALGRARELQRQMHFALDRAAQCERDRNYSEAIRQWSRVKELCPQHPDAATEIDRLTAAMKEASRAAVLYAPEPAAPPPETAQPRNYQAQMQERTSTPTLPIEKEPKRRSKRLGIYVSASLLAVAAGVALFLFSPSPGAAIRFEIDPQGADVSVDGRHCTAPCDLKLKPGNYVAEVNSNGYTPVRKEITATSHPETIVLSLTRSQPRLGTLTIETNIDDVAVLVDGAPKTLTSGGRARFSVVPGKHEIAVDKSGYGSEPQTVEIGADRESKLQFKLNPKEGRTSQPAAEPYLIVRSRPGAKVLVDGIEVGIVQPDGAYSFKTTPGRHRVELRLPDYASWTEDVTARPGGVAMNAELKELPKPLPVILSFTAIPSEIQAGQSTELRWQTQNASEVFIEGIGTASASNTKQVSPASTTLYTLVAKNAGREARSYFTVTVVSAPKPTVSLFEAGSEKIQLGQKGKLTWATHNATEVSISPDIGRVEPEGTLEFRIEKTTAYTLTAKGPGGTDQKSRQIVVEVAPVPVAVTPKPVPPPVPTVDPDIKAVQDAIEVRLKRALESMVVGEIKKVWPSMSKSTEKEFKDTFASDEIKAAQVDFKCDTPKISGTSAECTCSQRMIYTLRNARTTPQTNKVWFRLSKDARTWYVVDSHKAK
jgi:protein kinase-like protein/PEGA domain-containing protein